MKKQKSTFSFLNQRSQRQSPTQSFFEPAQDVDKLSTKRKVDVNGILKHPNKCSRNVFSFKLYNKQCEYKSEVILKRYRKNISVQARMDTSDTSNTKKKIIQHKNKMSNVRFSQTNFEMIPRFQTSTSKSFQKRNQSTTNLLSENSGKLEKFNTAKSFMVKSEQKQFHSSQVFEKPVIWGSLNRSFDTLDFHCLGTKILLQTSAKELNYFKRLRKFTPREIKKRQTSNEHTKDRETEFIDKLKSRIRSYSRNKNN